jgi:hypothetical protein
MTLPKIHEDSASIVLLGNFNPAIFQPAWLAAKGLVRESEAKHATIEVIHPDIAQYRLDWLHLSVQRERFAITTSDPSHRVSVRDLAIGIFGLLEQTPTRKLGLNRTLHVEMKDETSYHALGHLIAPKAPWTGILKQPGMKVLIMQGARNDDAPGRIHVHIEPSPKYSRYGVYFDVNSEYDEAPDRDEDPTAYFMRCISSDWERVLAEADATIEKLVDRVMEGTK